MMKRLKRKMVVGAIVLSLGFMLPFSAWSALLPGCTGDGKKEFGVYFGNGVGNTIDDAAFNLAYLINFMKANVVEPPNSCFKWYLAYNPTAGVFRDLVESAAQKFQEAGLTFLVGDLWRFITGQILTSNLGIWESLKPVIVSTFQQSIMGPIDQGSIDNHARTYKYDINEACANVLLVAHSQGNFYGNSAFDLATSGTDKIPPDHWRMVSVATPASYVATPVGAVIGPVPQRWATSTTDRVIKGYTSGRFIIPPIPSSLDAGDLSWGIDVPSSLDPIRGHAFIGYLFYSPTADRIKGYIQDALAEMPSSGCVEFSTSSYNAGPNDMVATITIQRTGGIDKAEQVQFDTADGTAQAGVDYVAVHGTQTIPAGQSKIDVPITIIRNSSGGTKTVNLTLNQPGTPSPGTQLGKQKTATLFANNSNNISAKVTFFTCSYSWYLEYRSEDTTSGSTNGSTFKVISTSVSTSVAATGPVGAVGSGGAISPEFIPFNTPQPPWNGPWNLTENYSCGSWDRSESVCTRGASQPATTTITYSYSETWTQYAGSGDQTKTGIPFTPGGGLASGSVYVSNPPNSDEDHITAMCTS